MITLPAPGRVTGAPGKVALALGRYLGRGAGQFYGRRLTERASERPSRQLTKRGQNPKGRMKRAEGGNVTGGKLEGWGGIYDAVQTSDARNVLSHYCATYPSSIATK